MNTFLEKYEGRIIKLLTAVGGLLALFLLVSTLGKLKENRFIGSGLNPTNTITVSGSGKIERAPDTAKISFSVRSESKELKTAQTEVSSKIDNVSKALKDLGIEEKYIKTEGYNSYPQYDYPQTICYSGNCPRPGNPTIRGYEVSHSVTVSVKDIEKVNDVLGVLGTNQVSDISGPSFGFEDDKAVAREARELAITDAQGEAKTLTRALGVKIVRIVSFNEGGSYPTSIYGRDLMAGALETKAQAPDLPIGDQKIEANVTIVYEIR